MLNIPGIHCYADDSTGDTSYTGRANASRSAVSESRIKLVSDIEQSLEQVAQWGRLNLVEFNPSKTQVCAFSAKKDPFAIMSQFQGTTLSISNSIGILSVDISADMRFRSHLEGKAKLASKKLGVLTGRNGILPQANACCYIRHRCGRTWSIALASGPVKQQKLPFT